ncbi:CASP-like protein [Drosera capensis]
MSRPAVHPVAPPPPSVHLGGGGGGEGGGGDVRVRMRDIEGMAGTPGGLTLRVCQVVFAVIALWIMASTSDFASATAFRFLVAASGLQIVWSLAAAATDVYALLVKRRYRNIKALGIFTCLDGVISTMTFSAACASAGITVLIDNDLDGCNVNHCVEFELATGISFLACFASLPSFLLNFWSLASTSRRT